MSFNIILYSVKTAKNLEIMIQKPYKMRPHCCWIAEVCAFKKRASHMLFPKFRVCVSVHVYRSKAAYVCIL